MSHFPVSRIRELRETAMSAGLGSPGKRDLLLAGIHGAIAGGLKISRAPSDQLLHDLLALNDIGRLADGTVPILIWLENAEAEARPRPQAAIFEAARNEVASQTEMRTVAAPPEPSNSQSAAGSKIAVYALVSLVSFLLGAAILGVMLWNAERLVALGLTGKLYYIVLLPLALSAAGFLFGIMHSYASYRGEQLGGVLELGGPIVAAALVVIGGFVLVPNVETFPVTVFVHGEAGPHDLVLKNNGYVIFDLGPDRRREPIGDKGQAYFPAIPAKYRGQIVSVWVDSDDYEPTGADQKSRLDSDSLYLAVRKRGGHVSGRVQDQDGNAIPDAEVQVAGISAHTDSFGNFELTIPGDRAKPEMELTAVAPGYNSKRYPVVPNSNRAVIALDRK
jgi:hypothetical protein